jgi:hypothetical protein
MLYDMHFASISRCRTSGFWYRQGCFGRVCGGVLGLTIRKVLVLGLMSSILLPGNIHFVANWLAEKGVVDWARAIRTEYFTETAITITVVLLILPVNPAVKSGGVARRCPVCDHVLLSRGMYCGECGSKVA